MTRANNINTMKRIIMATLETHEAVKYQEFVEEALRVFGSQTTERTIKEYLNVIIKQEKLILSNNLLTK